jgi:P22 coat protein - gene protein 5
LKISNDERFAVSGGKIGDTLNLRVPVKFTAATGASIVNQDVIETSVPLVINTQKHVAFSFLSKDRTLSIDRFAERYLDSAAVALANAVDVDGLTMAYQATAASVGTPGTPPNQLKVYNQAGAMLDKQGVPFDRNRNICISPDMQVEIVDALKGLFQSSEQIKSQYEKGRMGTAAGFDWIMDQNVRTHQVGPLGGTPAVSATAGQTGSTIQTVGWTAGAAVRLKKGDQIQFAGVFAVNPISGDVYSYLKNFVITADTSSDASGNAALPISPAIITTGPYKTCSAAPGAGALISVFGNAQATQGALANSFTTQGLAYHREAFALAMVPLVMPEGVHMSARSVDKETGMSIRMISQYDIKEDMFITRCDIAYGWAAPLPQMSCRVLG